MNNHGLFIETNGESQKGTVVEIINCLCYDKEYDRPGRNLPSGFLCVRGYFCHGQVRITYDIGERK